MNEKHYNSAIAVRLRAIVDGRQWSLLPSYLDGLSNANFRTAGYMLGEQYMPKLADGDFWTLAKVLVDFNAKAFLVTVLKSWCSRCTNANGSSSASDDSPSLVCPESEMFFAALQGRVEDQRKSLDVLLPILKEPTTVWWLIRTMQMDDINQRINAFVRSTTPTTAFLLFATLREVEDDKSLLVRTTYYLMKRGDSLSFNLASLLRSYFALEEVKGTFSLNLQPYELDRLSQDFEAFKKKLTH